MPEEGENCVKNALELRLFEFIYLFFIFVLSAASMKAGEIIQYIHLHVILDCMLCTLTYIITTFLDLFGMTPFWTCSAARPNPDRNGSKICKDT